MDKLLEILKECCPDIDFTEEKKLITDKRIDAMDLVDIISEIESEFDVTISMEELRPENFDSAEKMWELIREHQK